MGMGLEATSLAMASGPGLRGAEQSRRRSVAFLAAICSAIVLAALLVSCDSELDRPIRIVLPQGFSGPVALHEHPAYPDSIMSLPDCYEIGVSPDGVFRTRSLSIFERWHQTEAIDTTGAPVSDLHGGSSMVGGPVEGMIVWFYRGTSGEHDAFMYGPTATQDAWLEQRALAGHD